MDFSRLHVPKIEKALKKGFPVIFFLMDVLRAFHTTDHTRLGSHLRLQSWDTAIQVWTAYWLRDRSVYLFCIVFMASSKLKDGLPQKFPLFPILLPCIAYIVKSRGQKILVFGDDIPSLYDRVKKYSEKAKICYDNLPIQRSKFIVPSSRPKTFPRTCLVIPNFICSYWSPLGITNSVDRCWSGSEAFHSNKCRGTV